MAVVVYEAVAVLETIPVVVVTVARIFSETVNVVGVRLLSVAVPETELVDADTLVLMLVVVSEDVEVVIIGKAEAVVVSEAVVVVTVVLIVTESFQSVVVRLVSVAVLEAIVSEVVAIVSEVVAIVSEVVAGSGTGVGAGVGSEGGTGLDSQDLCPP